MQSVYLSYPITYDAQGNPTTYLGHTLAWEKGRQLKSFDGNTYTYNANGIRTSKTVNGVNHIYTLDGTKILCEAWDDNTIVPLYDNEDGVCGILYNDEPYYFQKNLQGDVIGIMNKDAQSVAKYSYDAWGVCTVTQDASDCAIATVNPYRYRGYYYDSEIGMYYLQSRYYDPVVGRFVNGDDSNYIGKSGTVLSADIFAYCENNAINLVDRLGARARPFTLSEQLSMAYCAGYDRDTLKVLKRYQSKLKSLHIQQIYVSKNKSEIFNSIAKFDNIIKTDFAITGLQAFTNVKISKLLKYAKALPWIGTVLSDWLSPVKLPSGTYTLFTIEAKYGIYFYNSKFVYIVGPKGASYLGLWVVTGKKLDRYRFGLNDFLKNMLRNK